MRETLSILAPLGWIYGLGSSARRSAYKSGLLRAHRLRSPVVSVGGLSMGGSMKTPAVAELGRALSARGPKVGVLGHGYRGQNTEPRIVSDGQSVLENWASVGDEAILLAFELPGCPVVVGRDKHAAGRLLEERFGRLIVLVDSGFQHLPLFRDLDIVCVSESDLSGRVLPAGRLRESAQALKAADIVFTDRETDGPRVERLRKERPGDVFSVARTDFGFFPFEGTGIEAEPPSRPFVFCAIGDPERFLKDVRARGVTVAGHRFFRDHHPFTAGDLKDLASAAQTAGADALVTTAKDAVRIESWPGSLPLLVLAARLDIENLPGVLKRIDRMILTRIQAGI